MSPLKALYDVPAPAKLNLFLHITGRRPDGYHLLQSVFMLIDWCDTLHFERAHRRPHQPGGPGKRMATRQKLCPPTIWRCAPPGHCKPPAAPLGVHIGLQKRIPSQAGMGGGSSDAASCLLALQRLWGVRLPPQELRALALVAGRRRAFFSSRAATPGWKA